MDKAICAFMLTLAVFVAFGIRMAPAPTPAEAAALGQRDMPDGCWAAVLLNVTDGDTVSGFYASSDPGHWAYKQIRVRGIDTPEKPRSKKPGKTWPAKCTAEAEAGKAATAYLKKRLAPYLGAPGPITARVCNVGPDKYSGRAVADIQVRSQTGWIDVGKTMVEAGHAFPNYKGGKKASWCACLEQGKCPEGYKPRTN